MDVPVRDTPVPWLADDVHPEVAPGRPRAAARPAKPAPASAPAEDFSAVTSLDALVEMVRTSHPRTPFSDRIAQGGIMLIGAGPAAADFQSGKPFTGPAGHLLDQMLKAIGLDRGSAYVALAAPRWQRPTPPPREAYVADQALVQAQIRLAAPRLLLLLGGGVVESLTGRAEPIGKLRGQWLDVGTVPALATYNPGYLLRRPQDKAQAWADLLAFKRRLDA